MYRHFQASWAPQPTGCLLQIYRLSGTEYYVNKRQHFVSSKLTDTSSQQDDHATTYKQNSWSTDLILSHCRTCVVKPPHTITEKMTIISVVESIACRACVLVSLIASANAIAPRRPWYNNHNTHTVHPNIHTLGFSSTDWFFSMG